MLFKAIIAKFAEIHFQKGEILADNVRRICKEQGKQLKDLAEEIRINPASLTRAVNGNARLDTIEKIAAGLSVSVKSLFRRTMSKVLFVYKGKTIILIAVVN